jgi:hypothetical protein
MKIEAALKELESFLPGLNYVVSLDLHRVPTISGGTPEQYVAAALGPKAVVGGTAGVATADMLAEVERCIRWAGDRGSRPDEKAINSPRLDELVACVLAHLKRVATRSTAVWSFWLKDGHPHYPVQWDFAFGLVGPGGAEVFIGSSSD